MTAEHILARLNTHYGIQATTLTPLLLGADLNATTYKAKSQNQTYFVKLKQGHHPNTILTHLQNAGIPNIIPPIKTLLGQPSHPLNASTLILYPFIEGQNAITHPLTPSQWITLGQTLKKIHALTPPLSLKTETYSPTARNFIQSLNLNNLPTPDAPAKNLLTFIRAHQPHIHRLLETTSRLAPTTPQPHVLCHSDLHAGNILHTPTSLYIIDWDDPILAPKERDLMFINGGVAGTWNSPHDATSFYTGYGPTPINHPLLAYYRHERILVDIAEYVQELLLTDGENGRGNDESRLVMYQHFIGMFEPNGVVDIAFKTYDNLAN